VSLAGDTASGASESTGGLGRWSGPSVEGPGGFSRAGLARTQNLGDI